MASLRVRRAGVSPRRRVHRRTGTSTACRASSPAVRLMVAEDSFDLEDSSLDAVEFFSPSKVNLFLRVVGKREDGYHDLASLFHIISLGDTLRVAPAAGFGKQADTLTCNWDDVPTDGSNLVLKAAELFREKTGSDVHYDVHLEKTVPHGAGLGGGSGNAATMLWAANELCGRPATEEQLLEWSGEIGSDISVFFSTGAAYCTGRGEVVRSVPPPMPLDIPMWLVKPPVGLSTPQIFKGLGLQPGELLDGPDPEGLLAAVADRGLEPDVCVNDLEAPAFAALPELAALKERMKAEGDFQCVFMSGSGSTMVGFGGMGVSPEFESEEGMFKSRARLVVRKPGEWYEPVDV